MSAPTTGSGMATAAAIGTTASSGRAFDLAEPTGLAQTADSVEPTELAGTGNDPARSAA